MEPAVSDISPPVPEEAQERLDVATRQFLKVVRELAAESDERFADAEVSAREGMVTAMAVQAIVRKAVRPDGTEFRAMLRGFGMGFGGMIAGAGEIGRATAVELFNGGLEYGLTHTLYDATPEGGPN
jgi:hypothetical protein